MTTVKKWLGPVPTRCDVCCTQIDDVFIDGRTIYGPWANMCCACHSQIGVGFGTGKGQKYERNDDTWVKVTG